MEYTYFAQEQCGDHLIKIGRTTNLRNRILTLARERLCPIKLLGVISFKEYGERSLHRQFDQHWREGEWFYPHSDLLKFIAIHAQPYEFPTWRKPRKPKRINPNKTYFRTRLSEFMDNRGVSLDTLSEDTGIPTLTLRRWINDPLARVDVRPLGILCMYFGCNPSEMLGL